MDKDNAEYQNDMDYTEAINFAKNNEDGIVYFEVNNWFRGRHYPDCEPFIGWLGNDLKLAFLNDDFVRENKLCVACSLIDMSSNFCITAKRGWVENNCPTLLGTDARFLRVPDKYGDVYGTFGTEFLPYCEDNIGIEFRTDD